MKLPLAFLLALATVVTATAQTAEPGAAKQKTTPRIVLPSDAPTAGKTAAPGKATKAAAGATADPKTKSAKKEDVPKIEGIEIPRGEKGFLGIQIAEATFKLSFYDAQKKPVKADVDRAALRWDPKYKVGEERVVLTPTADGKALTSQKNIRPPYNFKLFITLIRDAAEGQPPVNETLVIDFRQ